MPFVSHTADEVEAMLAQIGVDSTAQLFDEIPDSLQHQKLENVPDGLTELELKQLLQARAAQDQGLSCYAGAGAYEHHIPSAVWNLVGRGEFYTAYTPYQAEASQGSLQVVYEFQSMIAELTAMNVSNASMYDGASSLAEAVLMAVRANRKSKAKKILLPENIHPAYRETVKTIVAQQGIDLINLPFDPKQGNLLVSTLADFDNEDIAAVVVPQPNFFGVLEDVDVITDWAHQHNALVIAVVNPIALALLKPPGQWGEKGADIACGEGQPLGVPLSSGGPYFGFLTCKQAYVRQMPGRIIGRTTDLDGKEGFALTLQAREQHIRRSKATSNICTNQGLMVTAATIHMSILGEKGLYQVARACHGNSQYLLSQLQKLDGVDLVFNRPSFHEMVLRFNQDANVVHQRMAERGFLAGITLSADYPSLSNCLLLCVTETKTQADMDAFVIALQQSLAGEG